MIHPRHRAENGFTGLKLVITIIVLISIAAVLMVYLGGGEIPWDRTFPGGVVAESSYLSGDTLQQIGSIYGFAFVQNQVGTTRVVVPRQDPGRLGIVRLSTSLFIGDTGAIDMDRVLVTWDRAGGSEQLSRTTGTVLTCPNWTISNKLNLLPGCTADADDLLEPGEQFEITLCPSEGIPPNGVFTVTIKPDGVVMPLSLTRTAPSEIQPVMNLG
jgi:hypothetical protein